MRIDLNSFATIAPSQDSTPAQRSGATQISSAPTDGVTAQLSPDSKAVSSASCGQDIRQDRVAALRQAIEAGTYNIDATGIAAAMMDSMQTVRFAL
ncbi:MAG TPA: flagellar biosynthesis anti-sigma factor FlgM [Candidatus Acidoferrales bacterium]|nr:flagellar biosynthesis anti-sigma factor FlgM [Candidatus Acidoferrales bacterium]